MFERLTHLGLIAALTLTGCTADKVVGRYRSAVCETEVLGPRGLVASATGPVPCASVFPTASAFAESIVTPETKPPDVLSFSDHGQAAYMAATQHYSRSDKDFRANLAAAVEPSEPPGPADRSVFHRTLVVTVRKDGGFNPADRLEATDVVIRPRNARFESWDTVATAYTTINAGTVQLTQARGATESLSPGAPTGAPVAGSLSFGGSQTNTRVENLTASSQVETLTATVEEDGRALRIHRQGGYGIDLTGSTVIKVDLAYAPSNANRVQSYVFSVDSYTDSKGKPLPPANIALARKPVTGLPPDTALTADLDLTYTMRHVLRGGSTYEEKDDNVVERTVGPVRSAVMLVPAREASPPGYGLHLTGGRYPDFVVNAELPGFPPVGLCFDSAAGAAEFLAYMKLHGMRHPERVGNARLGILAPPDSFLLLTSDELAHAQVRAECR